MQVTADGGSPVSRSLAKNLVYEPRSMCALQPVGTHNAYEYLYGKNDFSAKHNSHYSLRLNLTLMHSIIVA